MFDIEKALITYLSSALNMPCYAYPPPEVPALFLTLERTGGASEFYKDSPEVAVQAWADTREEASALILKVRKLVLERVREDIPEVVSVSANSLYSFPDPTSRLQRYQMVLEFITRT